MKLIIFCGVSIQDKCTPQLHPINDIKLAIEKIDAGVDATLYSNSPDFVDAIKNICDAKNIEYEFYLDGALKGTEINDIFEDFNRSFKFLKEYLDSLK